MFLHGQHEPIELGHLYISCHCMLLILGSSHNGPLKGSRTFHAHSSPWAFAYVALRANSNGLPDSSIKCTFSCKPFPNTPSYLLPLWAPAAPVHVLIW